MRCYHAYRNGCGRESHDSRCMASSPEMVMDGCTQGPHFHHHINSLLNYLYFFPFYIIFACNSTLFSTSFHRNSKSFKYFLFNLLSTTPCAWDITFLELSLLIIFYHLIFSVVYLVKNGFSLDHIYFKSQR